MAAWPLRFGRLYALDLVQNPVLGEYSFEIAWYYNFRAPSSSSPTLNSDEAANTIIYFDGSGVHLRQRATRLPWQSGIWGDSGHLLWDYRLSTVPQASPALDPRGGIWYFVSGDSDLVRIDNNGDNIQTIDVNDIVDDVNRTFRPYPVMTISVDVDTASPVGIVAATTQDNSITDIVAIDLATEGLLWKYRIDEGTGPIGGTSRQYAMLINDQEQPVLFFFNSSEWCMGSCCWKVDHDHPIKGIDRNKPPASNLADKTIRPFAAERIRSVIFSGSAGPFATCFFYSDPPPITGKLHFSRNQIL